MAGLDYSKLAPVVPEAATAFGPGEGPTSLPRSVNWLAAAGVVIVYFLAGKFGLLFASIQPNASAFWPPAGIALAACLLFGYGIGPAIFVGAFAVNATTAGSIATSLGIAAGNTLEALAGAYLVNRFANGRLVFERPRDIFKFMALAAAGSTALSATIGVTTLSLGGYANWSDYGRIWLTWWLGDAAGDVVFAPLVVLWSANPRLDWDRVRRLEAGLLLVSLVTVAGLIYGNVLPADIQRHPIDFLIIPLLLWVVFRFGPREIAAADFLLSVIAIAGTLHGFGPYAASSPNSSLLLVQSSVCVMCLTLALAAGLAQRRSAEEARAGLAAIVNSSDDAIVSMSLEGAIRSWNPGAEQMFGWSAAEAVGRHMMLIIPEDRRAQEDQALARLRSGERIDHFETVRVQKNGQRIDVALTVSPLRDTSGKIVGASNIARDISERQRIESERTALVAAQRQAQENLRIVVESMAAPVSRCSRDLRYVWVSRPYADWLRSTVEEIAGRPIIDVLGPQAFAALRPYIERVLAGGRVEYEQRIPFRGPGLRWVHAVYTPTFGPDGVPDGWVAVVVDVDERRRMEDALKGAIASAEHARQEAEAGARARDEFLAMLSHELRNPLGAIQNALSVCRAVGTRDGETRSRALDIMNRQLGHLTRLMDDLLDTSRVIAGKIDLAREPVDLGYIAQRVLATLESADRVRGRNIVADCEPVWVNADLTRIEQVITNLFSNALKFTPPDGTIELRVNADGEDAVLTVRDTGAGIAPDLLGRIFDLFVQGAMPFDRSQSGLGVGLTLVRKLVGLHGGSVSARSAGLGSGSTFTIRLPAIAAPSMIAEPVRQTSTPSNRVRILLVEDNADNREMLSLRLRVVGHEVREAEDGKSAIKAARTFRPDVAIVDIGLPGINGYEVARQIRAMNGKRIRLFAVTGYGLPEDRRRAMEAGFDAHLTKPVDPGELLQLIEVSSSTEASASK